MPERKSLDRGRTQPQQTDYDCDEDDVQRVVSFRITARYYTLTRIVQTNHDSQAEIPPGYRAKVSLTKTTTSQVRLEHDPSEARMTKRSVAQFPSAPLYSIDEIVYVLVGENQPPLGPLLVVSIELGNCYRLKWKENGTMLHGSVSEDKLVVPS
jgi:hypothetical protein